MLNASVPYVARNMIAKKLEIDSEKNNVGNIETGFLGVSVFHNVVNEPIENAEVSVFKMDVSGLYNEEGEAKLITMHVTDKDGKIPLIELPVINTPEISKNGINLTSSHYFMIVNAYGYYSAYVFDIQIYKNVTTVYRINLSHITSRVPQFKFIFNPKII